MDWSFQNKKKMCTAHVLICGCQADMHATLVHLKQECDYNECVYNKLSSNAENSGMTKRIQTFSGIDTIDKVSIWDQLFNSQLLTLLCNWLRYSSNPFSTSQFDVCKQPSIKLITTHQPMVIPDNIT